MSFYNDILGEDYRLRLGQNASKLMVHRSLDTLDDLPFIPEWSHINRFMLYSLMCSANLELVEAWMFPDKYVLYLHYKNQDNIWYQMFIPEYDGKINWSREGF
jgi:hypothetical protein